MIRCFRALQPRRNDRPFPDGIRRDDQLSKQFDVKKLDDIIALIALYRPGPMELIPEYVKAKKGITPIKYLHPLLEDICADTYGVMIYQEQVMAAASKLAGYSLGGGRACCGGPWARKTGTRWPKNVAAS